MKGWIQGNWVKSLVENVLLLIQQDSSALTDRQWVTSFLLCRVVVKVTDVPVFFLCFRLLYQLSLEPPEDECEWPFLELSNEAECHGCKISWKAMNRQHCIWVISGVIDLLLSLRKGLLSLKSTPWLLRQTFWPPFSKHVHCFPHNSVPPLPGVLTKGVGLPVLSLDFVWQLFGFLDKQVCIQRHVAVVVFGRVIFRVNQFLSCCVVGTFVEKPPEFCW